MIIPFGDGEYETVYELTIMKSYLFGLIKKKVIIDYRISFFGNINDYESHWDNLIQNGTNF